jgi:hypothetical protein
MTEHKIANGLDFEALRRAIELRDPDLLLGFYAEDAGVRVLNGDAPERRPFELRGKAEIYMYLHAVLDQDTTSQLANWVSSEGRITFSEVCEYQDGTRVVVQTTLELSSEGEIAEQIDVVAQDVREEAGKGVPEETAIGRKNKPCRDER